MAEKEPVTECLKELAKDVYNDGGKAIVKPAGSLLGLIPRSIRAALCPFEKWILEKEYNIAQTEKILAEKLKNTPPENIKSPEAYIAVPALQYISYCMDNEELRNMYANLLANSMDTTVKGGVHPSYVEIIKQLCPDEAKIMKVMYVEQSAATLSVVKKTQKGGNVDVITDFSNVGEVAGCEYPLRICEYLCNLVRLGLLEKAESHLYLVNNAYYDALINHPKLQEVVNSIKLDGEFTSIDFDKGFVRISALGRKFCSICLDRPSASNNDSPSEEK